MDKGKSTEDFLIGLMERKVKVDILTQQNYFYAGFIIGVSDIGILLKDKYEEDVFLSLGELKRVKIFKSKEEQAREN